MVGTYRISQLAERAGVPATTLRYYEKQGLVPAARTAGGYRLYTDLDAERVQFIATAKYLGLPLDQIRELLGVWDGGTCQEVRDELRPLVVAQVTAADDRMTDLRNFRDRLTAALTHLKDLPAKNGPCDPACAFLHGPPARAAAPSLDRWSSSRSSRPRSPGDGIQPDGARVACSLDDVGVTDRIESWRTLLIDAEQRFLPDGGIAVQVPADRAGRLAELVVAEQECCPFFRFDLSFNGSTVVLTAHAPEGAEALVAALFIVDAVPAEESGSQC